MEVKNKKAYFDYFVETEIEAVRKTLEGNDVEAIKDATDKLTKVFYEISEKLYSANQAAAGANTGNAENTSETSANDGNVYDADYKVEDDNNQE